MIEYKCLNCGKIFNSYMTYNDNTVYCCSTCYFERDKEQNKIKRVYWKTKNENIKR